MRTIAWARLAPALLALAALHCGKEGGRGAGGRPGAEGGRGGLPIPMVEAVEARHGSLPLRERVSGTVHATGQVVIYPQASGPITEVMARNGQTVKEGDPLVRIRPAATGPQLAQARANLEAAKAAAERARANLAELEASFRRTELLARDSLVSEEMLETQRAQLEAIRAAHSHARAEVERAEANLAERRELQGQSVVRAPIAGRVGRRNAEVGMLVTPQTALFTIGRFDRMRVEVPVTQKMLGRLHVGQPAEIRPEGLGDTVIAGEISRISPFLAEGSFSAEAEIDVANRGGLLLPGMFVAVDIFYGGSETAALVPRSALYENPDTGKRGVFILPAQGREVRPEASEDTGGAPQSAPATPVQFRAVDIIAEDGQVAGISGVNEGEWVVVVGQHLLSGRPGEEEIRARVRPVTWEKILGLQALQRHDLLRRFMEKQQRLAQRRADSLARSGRAPSASGPGGR